MDLDPSTDIGIDSESDVEGHLDAESDEDLDEDELELWELPLHEAWISVVRPSVTAASSDGGGDLDDADEVVLVGHVGLEWRAGGLLCVVDGDGTVPSPGGEADAAELWLRLVEATMRWRDAAADDDSHLEWLTEVAAVHDIALGGAFAVDPWMRRFWDLAGLGPDRFAWVGTDHLLTDRESLRDLVDALRPGLVLTASPEVEVAIGEAGADVAVLVFDSATGTTERAGATFAFNAWALPASTLVR